ncbi:hypothetical protein EIN_138240 [Entamoeba invadens IP1]|uniref:Leucine rich repeat containing protein BspA family protein n=1 Tax=Entamoeba invadens IP1 TaxID=370355 RepID=L7FMM6_ENTIV|nr:hypothetical protein EIN_138240 [Entamoeba invadens IP1]ELP91807.1 hypothetical protein EIN_138240 [Entamoeba invadens IP1]|eukprot:XP_004258578.1 hypothetical protein EIN_138240 [Entamoeba invadens IP1]
MTSIRHIYGLEKITSICDYCFKNYNFLEEIVLSDDVKIEFGCFEGCTSLTKLKIPNVDMKVTFTPSLDETPILDKFGYTYSSVLFLFDGNDELQKFETIAKCKYLVEIKRRIIKDDVVKSITIPSNVTKIHKNFFHGKCYDKIDLGRVREVGNNLFDPSVIAVTIPTTLTKIGRNIFYKCTALKSVDLCGKKIFSGFVSIDEMRHLKKLKIVCDNIFIKYDQLFIYKYLQNVHLTLDKSDDTTALSILEIPENVNTISCRCFQHYQNLKEVILPTTLTSIEDNAFEWCVSLDTINFPESLVHIGKCAFQCCALTHVFIPKSVAHVKDSAFRNCSQLISATFPDTLFEYEAVFGWCQSLTSFDVLKTSKNRIKLNKTFQGCYYLKEIDIPNNVTSIENYSFFKCLSLTKISIGKRVERIGESCFGKCESLEDIQIPLSVTFIDNYAFKECSKLQKVIFAKKLNNISPTAFENCNFLSQFIVNNVVLVENDMPVSYDTHQILKKNCVGCKNVVFMGSDIKKHLKITEEHKNRIGEVPNDVVQLDENCFRNYKDFDYIKVPKSVRRIKEFCFYHSVAKENVLFEDIKNCKIDELAYGLKFN